MSGLRSLAREMLGGLSGLRLGHLTDFNSMLLQGIVYRDGLVQVELVVIHPNVVVPRHRHLHADTLDVLIAGDGRIELGSRRLEVRADREKPLLANGLHIRRGVAHGGRAGPGGAVYLSFQQWDREPTTLAEDWESAD